MMPFCCLMCLYWNSRDCSLLTKLLWRWWLCTVCFHRPSQPLLLSCAGFQGRDNKLQSLYCCLNLQMSRHVQLNKQTVGGGPVRHETRGRCGAQGWEEREISNLLPHVEWLTLCGRHALSWRQQNLLDLSAVMSRHLNWKRQLWI